jgi:hypothetical protein
MKSLSQVGKLFRKKEPSLPFLKLRVASALNVFVAIRGLEALLSSETAVVMRKGYETFVIQNASAIDKRENVLALVHVKDMECYDRLITIQTNRVLQRGFLDRTIADDLANEITTRLLNRAAKNY